MVLLSGSYMLYARHRAAPPPRCSRRSGWRCPMSPGRMLDNLRAAILRPQIAMLADRRALYRGMEAGLAGCRGCG